MSEKTVETNDDNFEFTRRVTPDGEYKNGNEITAISERGRVYAGEWVREQMNSSPDVMIGYWEDKLQADYLPVEIDSDSLLRHGLIVGATGYGKTSMLTNMARQFNQRGAGLLLVDPKGTASKQLKNRLPLEGTSVFEIGVQQSSTELQPVSLLSPIRRPLDDGFDEETATIIETVIRAVKSESYWGPTSARVAKAAVRCIVELNANYDTDKQKGFEELFKLLNDDEVQDETLKEYRKVCPNNDVANTIENADTEDIKPLLRRFKALTDSTRDLTSPQAPNIGEHVESNNVILLQPPADSDNSIASLIAERVWQHSQLANENEFYICVDELEEFERPFVDVGRKLAKGRGVNTGFYFTSQNLNFEEELLSDIFLNTENMVLMNPVEQKVANKITRHLTELGSKELLELERFEALFRTSVNSETAQKVINTTPLYPPLR